MSGRIRVAPAVYTRSQTRRATGTTSHTMRRGAISRPQLKAMKRIRDAGKETNHIVHGVFAVNESLVGGLITPLTTNITQGDGTGERVGNKISPTSILGRVRTYNVVANAIDVFRYTLIQWHPDTVHETPTMAGVFENTTYPSMSEFTTDKVARGKFTVLYDSSIPCSQSENDGQHLRKIKVVKMAKVQYNEDTTTGKNHIYEITCGLYATGSNNTDYQHQIVLRYKDM